MCCLFRPYRRQARSHRYCTVLESGAAQVGAGLPAMRPVKIAEKPAYQYNANNSYYQLRCIAPEYHGAQRALFHG